MAIKTELNKVLDELVEMDRRRAVAQVRKAPPVSQKARADALWASVRQTDTSAARSWAQQAIDEACGARNIVAQPPDFVADLARLRAENAELKRQVSVAESLVRMNRAMANDAIDTALAALKELERLKEVMRNAGTDSSNRPPPDVVTRAAHAKYAALLLAPEFDARLGRGNAAMENA